MYSTQGAADKIRDALNKRLKFQIMALIYQFKLNV